MEGVGRVGALRDGVFQGDGPPVEERSAPRKGRLFSLASDERLVTRVCDWFRAYGVCDISPYSNVYEDVVFRLPVELRRAETPAA